MALCLLRYPETWNHLWWVQFGPSLDLVTFGELKGVKSTDLLIHSFLYVQGNSEQI